MIRTLSPAWLLLFSIPSAYAFEQTTRMMDGGNRFWITMIAVQFLATLGYVASSLAQWAKWPDGTLTERLEVVQGFLTSILAGNIAYYAGYYYMAWPEIACFIATAVCGWGGDKFLSPLLTRISNLFTTLFGKDINGKQEN